MSNIVPFNSDDSMPDFYIEGKHARMTIKKTASYLKVSKQSVERYMSNHIDTKTRQMIVEKGFSGKDLNNITGYFATSSHVKKETKEHCINLLIDIGAEGFQARIDRMAGIVPEPTAEVAGITNDQFNILMTTILDLKNEIDHTKIRLTQEEKDKEHYLGITYALYPAQERLNRVSPCFEKFDRLEKLLKEVGKLIGKQGSSECFPISEFAKGHNLRHGEKINTSRTVCDWLKLSTSLEVQELGNWIGRKKIFPKYLKPMIDLAIQLELAKR